MTSTPLGPCFFFFAFFSRIDEVVLATGELQPLGAERPIKAPFAGLVKEILVREGQSVIVNQSLMRLDPQVSKKRAETLQTQLGLESKRFPTTGWEWRGIRAKTYRGFHFVSVSQGVISSAERNIGHNPKVPTGCGRGGVAAPGGGAAWGGVAKGGEGEQAGRT